VPLQDQVSNLPPLEAAKLYVVGAYAINTLFYSAPHPCAAARCVLGDPDTLVVTVYLKTQGINPAEHPIKEEMVRKPATHTRACPLCLSSLRSE
jgi:hypothetical protein